MDFKKQIESLQLLISSGIMCVAEGEKTIFMLKEKAVLKLHNRAINQRSDGRYITKVKYNDSVIQISAYSYDDLIIKLYDCYYGDKNSTLERLYPLWIDFRKTETSATKKTIKENGYIWNAHLKGQPITKKPLKTLSVKDYISFFRVLTKDRTMTRKRFNDMKSVMNGILYFAIEKEIINHNPLLDINYQQFSFKSENTEVIPYTENERHLILSHLSNDNLYDLAIQLDFQMTIRIGELKGLRFDDIHGNFIHVCRFINDKHEIIDDIKGYASAGKRWLPLTDDAKQIIQRIKVLNPDSEYLFMEDKERGTFITTITFNRHLQRCCKDLGIIYRSSHKVRFSTASILNNKGVTVPELQKMLGHTSSTMTHHYLKNVNSMNETYEKVANIFN